MSFGAYAILAQKGFFPASELKQFLEWDGFLGDTQIENAYRASKPQPDHLGTVFRWPSVWPWGSMPNGSIAESTSSLAMAKRTKALFGKPFFWQATWASPI